MGVAGWRFAHGKDRAAFVAFLEEWPGICSMAIAASSMIIMIAITLYTDLPQ